ncbi:MAG: ATP-binding protein [Muribaculaceae bacterium]|nr:ATP-binding protein [Muribaculaceae bacterium]
MEETLQIIKRPIYIDRLLPYVGKNIIKVLTGQRRVGKSYILKSVAQYIKENDLTANIISIDLEDFAFSHITDAKALHAEIISRLKEGCKNYIFIDEVQEIEQFDKVIRSLYLNLANDIYVTGSNSKMLSSEISTKLAGRRIEMQVHPLSYSEFLNFHKMEDSDEAMTEYLRFGGLPYLVNLPLRSTWNEYISGVTDAVVYRDIVSRHSLRNNDFLQRLLLFMADNIGQLFTAKKIADYLKSQRMSSSVGSVMAYVGYIEEAFIVNRSRRWEIEGKRFFEIGEKYFFEDLGIRNSIVGFRPHDISGLMENAVYNHLKILGYDVKTGIIAGGREIDFVAEKDGESLYVQVAMTVADKATAEREYGNLATIPDNYEKIVVTYRDSFPNTIDGIKTMSLREFLNIKSP